MPVPMTGYHRVIPNQMASWHIMKLIMGMFSSMDESDKDAVMIAVADVAMSRWPDDIIRQAEYINKCYGSLCRLIEESKQGV